MQSNTAYWGGDVGIGPTATATLIGGNFLGSDVSVDGGSIYNTGSLYITGTVINFARAPFGRGGAIDNLHSLTFNNGTIQDSHALSEAGAILSEGGASLLMSGDTFLSNIAGTNGGAVDNRGGAGMSNVGFFFNQASGLGGGPVAIAVLLGIQVRLSRRGAARASTPSTATD